MRVRRAGLIAVCGGALVAGAVYFFALSDRENRLRRHEYRAAHVCHVVCGPDRYGSIAFECNDGTVHLWPADYP